MRVRITGPVALGDEQFATLREGALRSTVFSVVSVVRAAVRGPAVAAAGSRDPRDTWSAAGC